MADLDDRKALIARLFGAANKHCDEPRMDGYLEALKRMETPRLLRVVDRILDGIRDLTDPADYKPPTAGELWKASRANLGRMPSTFDNPPQPERHVDEWERGANFLLLHKITRNLLSRVRQPHEIDYAPDSVYDSRARCVKPGQHTVVIGRMLHGQAMAWAADMREARAEGRQLDGKQTWHAAMQLADERIRAYIANHVRAAA